MIQSLSLTRTFRLIVVIAMLATVFIAAQPTRAADPIPNPAAEQYLLQQLQVYGYVDMEIFSSNPADRVVDGFFLGEVLKDPNVRNQPVLFILNATISDTFYGADLSLPAGLVLVRVEANGINFFNSQLQSFEIYDSTLEYLELSNASINRNLVVTGSAFNGGIEADNAIFKGNVRIYNNSIADSMSIARSTINGSADFRDNTVAESLNFYNTHITGEFLFDDSVVNGIESQFDSTNFPAEFSYFTVDGLASFSKSQFAGAVNFANTTFGKLEAPDASFQKSVTFEEALIHRSADFSRATISDAANFSGFQAEDDVKFEKVGFKSRADFSNLRVGNIANFQAATFADLADFTGFQAGQDVDFEGAIFKADVIFASFYVENFALFKNTAFEGNADFENASVLRSAEFTDATFKREAKFDYFYAERFLDFVNVTFEQGFSLYYASIAWPYFEGVTFNGPVNFEGLRASEDFEIADTSYNYTKEPFPMKFAIVEGAVKFINFTSPAGINLSNSEFRSLSIGTKNNPKMAQINLSATYILTDLMIEKVDMKEFLAESMYIEGSTTLKKVTITNKLDLRNAYIGFLKVDENFSFPNDPTAFNLRGMVYTDIDLGNQGLTEDTWQGLLLLIEQSAYSPQAYDALAKFLTDKGHPDWAGDVKLANKIRERDEVLDKFSGAWFWSWFLYIFAGYGYRPALALVWSGLVVVIGMLVFRRREDMLAVEQGDAPLNYSPFLYSFALFLPYINLDVTGKWEPNPARKWAHRYKYVHIMLGWVLAPVALLAVSGILG